MIIITGAAGFIGSNVLSFFNDQGIQDIILVDDFSIEKKKKNYCDKNYNSLVHRDDLIKWLDENHDKTDFIIHLGARTNTAEFSRAVFNQLNFNYSQKVWIECVKYNIPLIYASSAATYGAGEFGYSDDHSVIKNLKPLNPYGESKNDFDKWVLDQTIAPPFWAGLKFFNVYGPNEYHKDRMASVIFHAYYQIKKTGKMKLFKSHKPGISDGCQSRDFIYVKDVVSIIYWLYNNRPGNGIYNSGTGKARTFLDLVNSTFSAMDLKPEIEFIDTPLDIREKYQYFTEAEMGKLLKAGYPVDFYSLEDGVNDYVRNYLAKNKYV